MPSSTFRYSFGELISLIDSVLARFRRGS